MTTDNNAPADDVVAKQAVALANALGGDDADTVMDLVAAIERLRAERDKVYEALSDLCDKHHCLPGVNQIQFLDDRLSRLTDAQLRIRELEDGLREVASIAAQAEVYASGRHPKLDPSERFAMIGDTARALIERNSK